MKDILIVVDYQNDFVSEKGKVAKRLKANFSKLQKISKKIQGLIDVWHGKDNPVLFLVSDYDSKYYTGEYKKFRETKSAYGNTALKNTWGYELYKLEPGKKDKFITKHFLNGFYKTNLENYLKTEKIDSIYFCGVNTDVCVFHAAIGSMIRGYKTYVIEDATETISPNKQIFLDYLDKYLGVNLITSGKFSK